MTRLLVSVRNAAEARLALLAGVDLIDLKEPARGALAAVDRDTAREVVELVAGRRPLSVACGELREAYRQPSPVVPGIAFAKLGLAGCADSSTWQQDWVDWCRAMPPEVACVAVVYADSHPVQAPPPEVILELAPAAGCRAVLVDTSDKHSGSLVQLWTPQVLGDFVALARRRQLMVVLGGSLTLQTIPEVLRFNPDFVAVRGAACRTGRTGTVDPECLARLRHAVSTPRAADCRGSLGG